MAAVKRGAIAVFGAGLVWAWLLPDDLWAQNRNRNQNNRNRANQVARMAIQSQLQAARAQLQAAQAARSAAQQRLMVAESEASVAESRIGSVRGDLDSARLALDSATQRLRDLEAEIEASESDDSPLARARREYEHWQTQLQLAQRRVLNSPDYLARYAQADRAPNRGEQIAQARRQALADDADYQQAARRVRDAKATYDQLRHELFQRSDAWHQAIEAVRQARQDHNLASDQLTGGMLRRAAANQQLRSAQRDLLAAETIIAQGQAVVQRLESASRGLNRNNQANRNNSSNRRR